MTLTRSTLVFFIFALTIMAYNMVSLFNDCNNIVDYSIYQQAIMETAALKSLNPFVTVRDIFIFNEHFDPVIYLVAPIIWLTNFHYAGPLAAEFVWFLIFIFLALKLGVNTRDKKDLALAFLLIFFSRGILTGMTYPIHPVTWSIVPIFLVVYYLKKDNFLGVVLSATSLCFFKETYPFAVFGLSLPYLFFKEYRKFSIIFVISIFFIAFELKLRPLLFGETIGYGSQFLGEMLSHPVTFFTKVFSEFNYSAFFKIMGPFIIPLILMPKIKDKAELKWIMKAIFFILPLIALHVIINRFYFHHASKFSAFFIALTLLSSIKGIILNNKKIFTAMCFITILTGISSQKKIFKGLVLNNFANCKINNERQALSSEVIKYVSMIPKQEHIFNVGGIGPRLISNGVKIVHRKISTYNPMNITHLIFENPEYSNTWPYSKAHMNQIEKRCEQFASKVVIDNKFFKVIKGNFPQGCIFN